MCVRGIGRNLRLSTSRVAGVCIPLQLLAYSSAGVGKVSSDRDPLLPPGRKSTKPVTVDPWPS